MNIDEFEWKDHPSNPLIEPPWPEWMIADPTVLMPDESPDGLWHMFANSLLRLHHYTSEDGIEWKRAGKVCPGIRPFLRRFNRTYYLFFEKYIRPWKSFIAVRESEDLKRWGPMRIILRPSLSWHGRILRTCGNPCVLPWRGEFLLFYSAATVLLKDCMFPEPRYIGIAKADHITGPYNPHPRPIFSPDPADPYRNLGAGAIKVVADERRNLLWGFNNGIFIDPEGHSRSAIMLLKSVDGINWEQDSEEPIIEPEEGWKCALVYALDVKFLKDRAYLYYNARDGWLIGKERIGLSVGKKPGK